MSPCKALPSMIAQRLCLDEEEREIGVRDRETEERERRAVCLIGAGCRRDKTRERWLRTRMKTMEMWAWFPRVIPAFGDFQFFFSMKVKSPLCPR